MTPERYFKTVFAAEEITYKQVSFLITEDKNLDHLLREISFLERFFTCSFSNNFALLTYPEGEVVIINVIISGSS